MDRVEVVCVTMGQKDLSIAEKMHITGNAVFGNQADGYRKEMQTCDGRTLNMITTDTRGVGVNRNIPGISCFLRTMMFAMPTVMPMACAVPMRNIRMRI